jgi:hypothetical protein
MQHGGENSSNYANPEFDRLFEKMKRMSNTPERLTLIRAMKRILQHDAPWIFAFHPKTYTLAHAWLKNPRPENRAALGAGAGARQAASVEIEQTENPLPGLRPPLAGSSPLPQADEGKTFAVLSPAWRERVPVRAREQSCFPSSVL